MALDPERAQSPKTWSGFTRALGSRLPRRMGELRRIGKQLRTLSRSKGKR